MTNSTKLIDLRQGFYPSEFYNLKVMSHIQVTFKINKYNNSIILDISKPDGTINKLLGISKMNNLSGNQEWIYKKVLKRPMDGFLNNQNDL